MAGWLAVQKRKKFRSTLFQPCLVQLYPDCNLGMVSGMLGVGFLACLVDLAVVLDSFLVPVSLAKTTGSVCHIEIRLPTYCDSLRLTAVGLPFKAICMGTSAYQCHQEPQA